MGAFCVFGVSRAICRKQAEKNTPTFVTENHGGIRGSFRRELTVAEWGEKVRAETELIFEASEKVVRISPELDTPQFCHDWVAAAPGEVKLTKVMCRGEKIDKSGGRCSSPWPTCHDLARIRRVAGLASPIWRSRGALKFQRLNGAKT